MRQQRQAELWEQLWQEYDARQREPYRPIAPLPLPERRKRPRGRALRAMLACCIVVSATGYAIAPLMADARLGEALTGHRHSLG